MSEFTFTDANFEDEVLKHKGLVMVDFFAPWCGPCKMMAPAVEKISEEYQGKAKVGKLNIDENGVVADKYGIQSIPTIYFFRDGKVVGMEEGYQSAEALRAKLDSL